MLKPLSIITLASIAAFGLAGCSESNTTETISESPAVVSAPAHNLVDGEWHWVDGIPSHIGVTPFVQVIQIKEEGVDALRLVGFSGCNSFRGTATQVGENISFGNLSISERACDIAGVMEQETQLMGILNQTGKYAIEERTLTLQSTEGETLQSFELK